MLTELYSFNWYLYNENELLKRIADCICSADRENTEKMRLIYPAIVLAHDEREWDKAPEFGELKPVRNCDKDMKQRVLKERSSYCKEGSFNWYLYNSGHFVTKLAKVILFSEKVDHIRRVYPQMIGAMKEKNWSDPPFAFKSDCYNAEPL